MAKEKCKQPVVSNRDKACTRSAVKDGYCGQHHPDTVKARDHVRDMRQEQRLKSTDEDERRRAVIYFLTNDIPTDTLAGLQPNFLRWMISECLKHEDKQHRWPACSSCGVSVVVFK